MDSANIKEIHLSLLNRFVDTTDFRDWLGSPFNWNNKKTMATNGHSLIAVPIVKKYPDQTDKISSVYPCSADMHHVITYGELKEKLAMAPMIDCYDEETVECNACYGEHEVNFEFRYKGRIYEHEAECPICEGQGKITGKSKIPNGKKEYDKTKFFQIGNTIFHIDRILDLLFVSETLQSDIVLLNQFTNRSYFMIKDVEVLLAGIPNNQVYREIFSKIEVSKPIISTRYASNAYSFQFPQLAEEKNKINKTKE
jgi:hypothetical protein